VTASSYHEPVLVEETLRVWVTDPAGRYVDGTVGGGGHAFALLSRFADATLVGLDRDPEALEAAALRLQPFRDRVHLVRSDYADLAEVLPSLPGPPVGGILFDVGVSSRQLDAPERGFSYLAEGPLRLSLDRDATADARSYLDEVEEGTLKRIFREYGDLPQAGRAARLVLEARAAGRLETTTDLADALRRAGAGSPRRLSQAFQALRMAVNDELGSLRRGIDGAARLLPAGGALAVISFESVMDREVKRAFRPPRLARPLPGVPDPDPVWEPLTRKAVRPSEEETTRNPRSRSARLRAARRTPHALPG
jgi:16S rRNA (cytosine1402-N4)-methyltransferase